MGRRVGTKEPLTLRVKGRLRDEGTKRTAFCLLPVLSSLLPLLGFLAPLSASAATPLLSREDGRSPTMPETASRQATQVRMAVVNFKELAEEESADPPPPTTEASDIPFTPAAPRPADFDRVVAVDTTGTAATHFTSFPCSPTPSWTFQALDDNNAALPPDTHGAVGGLSGGTQYHMTVLNTQVRIKVLFGGIDNVVTLAGFWASLGNPAPFDPKVLYDPFGQRWIFTATANAQQAASSLLIGVSQTSDPTGTWNLFSIDVDAANLTWADYPSIGFNTNWIAVSVIMINIGGGPVGSDIFVFNRANLYAGTSSFTRLQLTNQGLVHVPAITYDNTQQTLFVLQTGPGNVNGMGNVALYTITNVMGTPTLNFVGFIAAAQTWDPYRDVNNNGIPDDLAPQRGSSSLISTNDDRIQNVVFRNGSLWTAHTIFLPATAGAPPAPFTPTRSSIQWWEINPAGTPAVVQRGLIDDPTGTRHFAFPSIAVNPANDVLIGYSSFSPGQFASASYSYRDSNDPINTMRSEVIFKAGLTPYDKTDGNGRNRWGDYSSTTVDQYGGLWTIQAYADTPFGWDWNPPQVGLSRWATQWALVGAPNGGSCSNPYLEWSLASLISPTGFNMNGHDMSYDSARSRIVLYRGDVQCPLGQCMHSTWEWDGGVWLSRSPSTVPGSRVDHRMTYDAGRSKTVLFGGWNGSTAFGDTWEYDGTNWSQVSAGGAGSPPARAGHGLAYDAANGDTVLFGGQTFAGQALGDTWIWNGSSWSQQSPANSPAARAGLAMTYDGGRGVVLLHGGSDLMNPTFDETWEWNGTTWTQRFPVSTPGPRSSHDMAYDATRDVVVLYGGAYSATNLCDWDGTNWKTHFLSSGGGRISPQLAYDLTRREMVMFEGDSSPPGSLPETQIITNSSRAFCLTGSGTGTNWSWSIGGAVFEVTNNNVTALPAGASAAALAAQFVNDITAVGNCGEDRVDAAIVPTAPNCFTITVGQRETFNLLVGPVFSPSCCLSLGAPCTFNPEIAEVGFAGADCDGNLTDDAIDIAAGTLEDLDGNGIPDVCECTPGLFGDVDHNGYVDVGDILCVLDGFADFLNCSEGDLFPCEGNGEIDVGDVLAALDAFSGSAACPPPCN